MPGIAGSFENQIIIDVMITRSPPILLPSAEENSGGKLTITIARALIDTGASFTCISPEIAQKAGLDPKGKRAMMSASHEVPMNYYLFYIGILRPHRVDMDTGAVEGSMDIFDKAIEGFEFMGSSAFDVLLGMDVLTACSFKLDHDGHYSLYW